MGLIDAAETGDRWLALTELRAVLAAAIASCESKRDLPGLSRQFQSVLAELDDMAIPGVVSPADRIAQRRRGIR
jgi:hypothetical protein